jgi:hypothetical protein
MGTIAEAQIAMPKKRSKSQYIMISSSSVAVDPSHPEITSTYQ